MIALLEKAFQILVVSIVEMEQCSWNFETVAQVKRENQMLFGCILKEEFKTTMKKLLKNKFLKKYAFISYQYNILSKLKKKLNSVGTSPMDWFYKEK